ncbi:MAG: translation elongation factor-like protein [bacterium]|nr:MAG: translation elongation factor-like protein [bacterium]
MEKLDREKAVGVVRDYFRKVGVAAVEVTRGRIGVGDTLRFQGATTDLVLRVDSMQVNHQDVIEAAQGELVGIKVAERVRENDLVFLEGGGGEEVL